jgi:hypothetical protein
MRTYRLFIISNEYTPPGKEEFTFDDFERMCESPISKRPEELSVYMVRFPRDVYAIGEHPIERIALNYLRGRAFDAGWSDAGTFTLFDISET